MVLSFFLTSCHVSNRNEANIVAEWVGKEINIPEQMKFQIIDEEIDIDMLAYDYKIVNYVDSNGCTSCRMKLPLWKEVIDELHSLPDISLGCLTIINTSDKNEIESLLKRDVYLHPIAVDSNNIFAQLNELPKRLEYNTFLLDADNKVLAIGNPVLNPKIKELYKRIILNGEDELLSRFNGLYACSFGLARRNSSSTVNYTIVNNDSITLHIQTLIPSCDCVNATAYSDIVLPSSEIEICLTFSTDASTGEYYRYVDVFYEEKDNPDRLIVYGLVK